MLKTYNLNEGEQEWKNVEKYFMKTPPSKNSKIIKITVIQHFPLWNLYHEECK